MFIAGISFIDILQELDFVKTLIKVVLVVLQPAQLFFLCLSEIFGGSARNRMQVAHRVDFGTVQGKEGMQMRHAALHCVMLVLYVCVICCSAACHEISQVWLVAAQ